MVKDVSSNPLVLELALDGSERRRLNWLAVRYALVWAACLGTAFVALAAVFFPDAILDALWWYPFAFAVAFYFKRRALWQRAQAMLEAANARAREFESRA